MNNQISQCKATVEMSLEQIVDIEKAFTRVQELEQEVHDIKLQLATAKEDLRVICKYIYVSPSRDYVWVDNFGKLTSQEQEDLLFAIKRNQNV
jgi:hypothetical protein